MPTALKFIPTKQAFSFTERSLLRIFPALYLSKPDSTFILVQAALIFVLDLIVEWAG